MKSDLSAINRNWDAAEQIVTCRLREMTQQESVAEYLKLQRLFEPQLQVTDAIFRPQREAHLIALQEKLRRFGEWERQSHSGKPHRVGSQTSESP